MERKYTIDSVMRMYAPRFLFFWGHTEKGGNVSDACLSQWYTCYFFVDGVSYCCAEQYMMARKTLLFGDREAYRQILETTDPMKMKKIGRLIQGYDDATWGRHKFQIVVEGNYAKFSQNPHLSSYLCQTGDKVLVEASPYDTIWGIGMSKNDKDVCFPRLWKGENLLEFALMEVRDLLNQESAG